MGGGRVCVVYVETQTLVGGGEATQLFQGVFPFAREWAPTVARVATLWWSHRAGWVGAARNAGLAAWASAWVWLQGSLSPRD
jgi:hypothetical protein